jgi:hypothetical protein
MRLAGVIRELPPIFLAIRFGYYRDQTDGMGIAVSARVILVQVVQSAGDFLARRAGKKMCIQLSVH